MKKILFSMASIGVVAAVAIVGTGAFFSDEEVSTGNTFVAGAIDLMVDSTAHYDGLVCVDGLWEDEGETSRPELIDQECTGSWEWTDLDERHVFFDYDDLKPGDYGENTLSLHVYNNDAYACVIIDPTMNDDNGSTEPELEVDDPDGDSIFDGELAQNMRFRIWVDMYGEGEATPGDNIFQEGYETVLTEGDGPITPVTWALAAPGETNVFTGVVGEALVGSHDYYLGVEWGIADTVGNIIQTDKYMADISFYVEQSRNNEQFFCPISVPSNTLRLENERETDEGPWEVIVDDKWVDMTYNSSGETFDYTLNGQGLAASTEYSLIYYADGWPGNNPGALIGTHNTDSSGALSVGTINKELSMDLPTMPDGNFAIGAKIWLIPSTAYNAGSKSVTAWPPNFNTWFFEGNVYIQYDDTGTP